MMSRSVLTPNSNVIPSALTMRYNKQFRYNLARYFTPTRTLSSCRVSSTDVVKFFFVSSHDTYMTQPKPKSNLRSIYLVMTPCTIPLQQVLLFAINLPDHDRMYHSPARQFTTTHSITLDIFERKNKYQHDVTNAPSSQCDTSSVACLHTIVASALTRAYTQNVV